MIYRQVIMDGCDVGEREAAVIEELVRVEIPTLEHLTRRQLVAAARRAHENLEILRDEDPRVAAFYEESAVLS